MVKSNWCILSEKLTHQDVVDLDECPEDQGGYFIVNGSEKVVVGQEKLAQNDVFFFRTKFETEPWVAEVRSRVNLSGSNPYKFTLSIKVERSVPRVYAYMTYTKKAIPLFLVLKALGMLSDIDIIESIFGHVTSVVPDHRRPRGQVRLRGNS